MFFVFVEFSNVQNDGIDMREPGRYFRALALPAGTAGSGSGLPLDAGQERHGPGLQWAAGGSQARRLAGRVTAAVASRAAQARAHVPAALVQLLKRPLQSEAVRLTPGPAGLAAAERPRSSCIRSYINAVRNGLLRCAQGRDELRAREQQA